jgi:hypothetical protein
MGYAMHVALSVFDVLNSFNRPITRREIEEETGLSKNSVENGLFTLRRLSLLIELKHPRRIGKYSLIEGAERPQTLRGRYERTDEIKQMNSDGKRTFHMTRHIVPSSVASPPSHASAPGGARLVIKGMLDVQRQAHPATGRCLLSLVWKK